MAGLDWRMLWTAAHHNMPRYTKNGSHSTRVLRMLLGYKTVRDDGRPLSTAEHVGTAKHRGDKPRDPERQHLLRMLAGPHGSTIAKAVAIKKGIDLSKWKYWP